MDGELNDSSDDLFITQTAPEYKFVAQDEEYDCSYLNSQYEANWSVPVGEVEYWDFSNERDNSSEVPSSPFENDYTRARKQAFEEILSDDYFGDDENVSFSTLILSIFAML